MDHDEFPKNQPDESPPTAPAGDKENWKPELAWAAGLALAGWMAVAEEPVLGWHGSDCHVGESAQHWYDSANNFCINWPVDCMVCSG